MEIDLIPQRGAIGGGGIGGTTDEEPHAAGLLLVEGEIGGGGIGGTTDVPSKNLAHLPEPHAQQLQQQQNVTQQQGEGAFNMLGIGTGGKDDGGPELRGAHKVGWHADISADTLHT